MFTVIPSFTVKSTVTTVTVIYRHPLYVQHIGVTVETVMTVEASPRCRELPAKLSPLDGSPWTAGTINSSERGLCGVCDGFLAKVPLRVMKDTLPKKPNETPQTQQMTPKVAT